ncbi:hypothetical protein ACH4UR_37400 [Streptomyces lydicus]|uniref:hypothetical protein n=1 Tax=Streptomyces lydicus TaxID=47763 RepID=UPI00340B94A3
MPRTRVRPLGHCYRCTRACWKEADDASRWNTEFDRGVRVGLICPECQTPAENAEAEVKAATLDYAHTVADEDGREKVAPLGGWHTVTAMGHPLVREDKAVHLVLAVESAELRFAVGPQSDARLHDLFAGPSATVVRLALEQEQARPGQRAITYNLLDELGPDTVLLVEDHALCEDGEDRGELLLSFSPSLNPHLLSAFTPPVADALRAILQAA